ncbi:MAG: type III-B CRISPR module RAMP protein Cmr4 [Methanothrix sp.]|nr:type III-B CRISPR module RAMP protein Cmr4 [Methanothrix sp.]
MMNTRMYWVHAITPLHVGSGRGIGFIDLPIMREKVTSWPLVPGSAVKGVLREHFVREFIREKKDMGLINAAFGKPDDDKDNVSNKSNAGSLVLSDARIICLPVRSLYGTFAFAACPLVLERLKRDLDSAGHQSKPVEKSFEDDEAVVTKSSKVERNGKVLLEDLDFDIITDLGETDAWADLLAQLLFANDPAWQTIFKERFVILSNNCFNFLSETGTEVNARIKINQEKKIVENGALWYEEALPSETILAGLAWCDKDYSGKGVNEEKIFETFCPDTALNLQIGGKATVGKGRVRCLFTKGAGE